MIRRRTAALWGGIATAAVVVVVALVIVLGGAWRPSSASGPSTPSFQIADATSALGPTFHPGIILGAAANATGGFVGGIGVYVKSPEFDLPAVASVGGGPSGLQVTNVTALLNAYFWEGGIYGVAWNGSGWLVAGQAAWGGGNFGTAVSIQGGVVTNLTSRIFSEFNGGGVFAVGWNGTAWLLGGNDSAGPTLAALAGTTTKNLSGELHGENPSGWIQVVQWNGFEWMVGGLGVLAVLHGATAINLLPGSPYAGNGVWSSGWNGTAWVVGGGAGRALTVVNDRLEGGPTMPSAFNQAVLFVQPLPHGWLIGGKGLVASTGGPAPALVYWASATSASNLTDLTGEVPASFDGGEIQGGCLAPFLGPSAYLLVGDGANDVASGYGLGAMAELSVTGE